MSTRMTRFNEARALQRVADAAHEVQAASAALPEPSAVGGFLS
jgi:hypothetical protein